MTRLYEGISEIDRGIATLQIALDRAYSNGDFKFYHEYLPILRDSQEALSRLWERLKIAQVVEPLKSTPCYVGDDDECRCNADNAPCSICRAQPTQHTGAVENIAPEGE